MDERISKKENFYALDWEGPYDYESLSDELEDYRDDAVNKWCLYALLSPHPLYGAETLTYIGKAVKQSIETRLSQHKWWEEKVYIACIYEFKSWEDYNELNYNHAIERSSENAEIISAIEELLIFSLAPAYNSRNRKSALNSLSYRVFNTGEVGPIPAEISGLYNIEKGPEPEKIDEDSGDD